MARGLCGPADEALVYRVHYGGVRYGAHEMGGEAAVESSCAFLGDDEAQCLYKAVVLDHAVHARLAQACAENLQRVRKNEQAT